RPSGRFTRPRTAGSRHTITVRKEKAMHPRFITILSLLALGLSAMTRAQAAGPPRRALLIGAHAYQHHDPKRFEAFEDLNTETDVQAIRQVLIDHFQFDPANITVVTSREETSRDAILRAIRTLINETHAGDIVYFHYSGHGSQVPDS